MGERSEGRTAAMKADSLSKAIDRQNESVISVLKAVADGMDYDPGHSDLDNEQPINVSMTLGDYRKAKRLLYELRRP